MLAAACGRSEPNPPPRPPPSPSEAATPPPPSAAATQKPKTPRGPIDPSKTGTITGVARFEGEAPARKPISAAGSGGCPEHATPPLSEDVIVENGLLANVFVHIKDGLDGWDLPPPPSDPVAMDQKGCIYTPHVVGMRVGGKIQVQNSDPTSHNVNVRSRANDGMNPIQPPGSKPVEWSPTKKELGASFECSLHPWMRAYVCVVDQPWFAVTGPDGAFTLSSVPPGDYILEAWHEKYGKRTAKVSLEPGGSGSATFTFKP